MSNVLRTPYSCFSTSWLTCLTIVLLFSCYSRLGKAAEVELTSIFSNDSLFDSDGSGVTGSLELAAKADQWRTGAGVFVVTPELLKEKRPNDDPLTELSRIPIWFGKTVGGSDRTMYHLGGRLGLEGGVADDIGFYLHDIAHALIGKGSRDLSSSNETRGLAGVSAWVKATFGRWCLGHSVVNITPYGHASVGFDTVEGGGGMVVALQPGREMVSLAILLPKNGSYAPVFGGDGIGFYGGVRGIAHESLYDGRREPFVGEAGLFGQTTLFNAFSIAAGASCTTEPYEGAIGSDCKADLRIGYKWSTSRTKTVQTTSEQ